MNFNHVWYVKSFRDQTIFFYVDETHYFRDPKGAYSTQTLRDIMSKLDPSFERPSQGEALAKHLAEVSANKTTNPFVGQEPKSRGGRFSAMHNHLVERANEAKAETKIGPRPNGGRWVHMLKP